MDLDLASGARGEAGIDVVEDTHAGETGVQIPPPSGIAFYDGRQADESPESLNSRMTRR